VEPQVWVAREYGYTWNHIGHVLGILAIASASAPDAGMKILRARLSAVDDSP